MRRRWLIPILALIPIGAIAAVASGIDVPSWLSERLETIRTAVKPTDQPAVAAKAERAKPAAAAKAGADANASGGGSAASRAAGKAREDGATRLAMAAPANPAAAASSGHPSIDVARLDPNGMSVIAGSAEPGKEITILADGEPIAVAKADANGEWVVVTAYSFQNADPTLEVRLGAMPLPRAVAAAAAGRQDANAMKPTAAAVTERMLRELERLTDNASTAGAQAGPALSSSTVARHDSAPRSASGGIELSGAATSPGERHATRVASRALVTGPGTPGDRDDRAQSGSIPVPVQFVYREAAFTERGREAAALLLRYFKARQFKRVELSGHADERGSEGANMELSKSRLEHLAKFLRDGGFEGELKLVPKGETEKYGGVDRNKYPLEELWQLDRRVEVVSVE